MARFCTRCGTQTDDSARFCDSCGHRFSTPAATTGAEAAPAPAAQAVPLRKRRPSRLMLAVLATVLVAGGGLAWWLQPEQASEQVFAKAIDSYLQEHADAQLQRSCLGNFDYRRSPVHTNVFDNATNNWLGELVQAGIYTAPQRISAGWSEQFQYTLTSKGQATIKNGRLCLGDGIQVSRVESFSPPEVIAGLSASKARFRYQLRKPAAWLTPAIQREWRGGEEEPAESLVLLLKDGKWQVAERGELNTLQRNAMMEQLQPKAMEAGNMLTAIGQGGLLATVKSWFGVGEPSEEDILRTLNLALLHEIAPEDLRKESCQPRGKENGVYDCLLQMKGKTERIRLRRQDDDWKIVW